MTQRELNRAVARATGETVREITHLGFVPLSELPFERDPEDCAVDWDGFDAERNMNLLTRAEVFDAQLALLSDRLIPAVRHGGTPAARRS